MTSLMRQDINIKSETKPHGLVAPLNGNGKRKTASKLHILFYTSTLGGGGAEKHLLRVLNHLDREKFRVSLALVKPSGQFEPAVAADVTKYYLTGNREGSSTLGMLRSIRPLRRLIRRERPDLIFSVIELANFGNIFAARGIMPAPKIVIGVQTPPSIAYSHSRHPISRLMLRLIPRVYPRADRVVALSKGVAADLVLIASGTEGRVAVIHNAGVEADLREKLKEALSPEEVPQRPLLLACGRLKALKGFDYLLDALVEVRKTVPASLWIVGEGEERLTLELKIRRLGLEGCVRLLGFQENPFKYMAAADLFVLSSLYEGFGNVIVEAMACGVPVVATNCPYGPGEIIEDGRNGILAPPADAAALAAAILRVLSDENIKQKLSIEGKDRANDFEAHAIAAAYGELFLNVVNGSSPAGEAGVQ
jgi:glycosyltransferase involved in cell wall biosynthesis